MNRKELIKEISSEKEIDKSLLKCLNTRELEILCKMDDDKFENMVANRIGYDTIKTYKSMKMLNALSAYSGLFAGLGSFSVIGLVLGNYLIGGLLFLLGLASASHVFISNYPKNIRRKMFIVDNLREIVEKEVNDGDDKFFRDYEVVAEENLEDIYLPKKESGKQQSRGMEK